MKEYSINNKIYRLNLFDKVENKEQAYLLGYLLGDGGFHKPTHKRNARLFVSSSEKYIIQHFQETYCPDSAIGQKIPVNTTRRIYSKKLSYTLNFSSKFSEMFNKYGLLSIKVDRDIINIPKRFMKSYIHGLVDADGHYSWGRRKDRDRLWCNFAITHQSLKSLVKVQKYLSEELGISSYINPRKDEKCLDLKLSKISDIVKVIEWLYTDTPKVFNTTKRDKALSFIEEYKKHY